MFACIPYFVFARWCYKFVESVEISRCLCRLNSISTHLFPKSMNFTGKRMNAIVKTQIKSTSLARTQHKFTYRDKLHTLTYTYVRRTRCMWRYRVSEWKSVVSRKTNRNRTYFQFILPSWALSIELPAFSPSLPLSKNQI